MCGRITIPGSAYLVEKLGLRYLGEERPTQINIPPGGFPVPVTSDRHPGELEYFQWPLIPSWSPEPKVKFDTCNAKIETIEELKTWKSLIGRNHCVIYVSAFYEWNYDDPVKKKGSHPHIIKQSRSPVTRLAGLWSSWADRSTGEIKHTCSIITLGANEFMAEIHNTKARMPAFLTESAALAWNDPQLSKEDRMSVLQPVENDFLVAKEISSPANEEEVFAFLAS